MRAAVSRARGLDEPEHHVHAALLEGMGLGSMRYVLPTPAADPM